MSDEIREVFFDLETTGLFAKTGDIILSCVFLPMSTPDKPYTFTNDDVPDDSAISADVKAELVKYDRLIGWNSNGFDMKFLNERLRINGERPLFHRGSFDMKEYLSKMYPYMSGRQDDWGQALGITHQKTPLDIVANQRMGRGEGTPEDWKDLLHHNEWDVLGMWEIYQEVMKR